MTRADGLDRLHTICASTLGAQIWCSEFAEQPGPVRPVRNAAHPWNKPDHGSGMWTSSPCDGALSSWVRWCADNDYGHDWGDGDPKPAHVVLTPEAVPIIEVRHAGDLRALNMVYGIDDLTVPTISGLDFEAMAADRYFGLHLTDHGESATRFERPGLYGWDCESTLWFHDWWQVE